MLISGETVHYELTHLNLYCLQKPQYCFGTEGVKRPEGNSIIYEMFLCCYTTRDWHPEQNGTPSLELHAPTVTLMVHV